MNFKEITDPSYLVDFADEAINVASQNFKKSAKNIVESDPNAPEGVIIATPPFAFGTTS